MEMNSDLIVRRVASKKDLRSFVDFPYRLYSDDPNWIPQLRMHELEQFDPDRNPAFDSCEAQFYLAERNGQVVGRVAAIINWLLIDKENKRIGRFGWFECEQDREAASALIRTAEGWLREEGMTEIAGPLGFSDNDPTGFLVEGFDELPPIAGSYSPPWYNDLITSLGYSKEVDYVEYRITVPDAIPEKVTRMVKLLERRTPVRVFSEKNRKVLAKHWGPKLFETLNRSFAELYGTTPLSERQISYYIDTYLGQVDPEFIKIAVDGEKVVGFVIAMPSLSRAFQKAKGRLFPFGVFHILLGMKKTRILDFYLAGILPEYQGTGIDALLAYEMARSALKRKMEYAESNRELESNTKVQALWKLYDKRLHRRTRVYSRKLIGHDGFPDGDDESAAEGTLFDEN
jgi:GNAT superfamily N-acetyltransferase